MILTSWYIQVHSHLPGSYPKRKRLYTSNGVHFLGFLMYLLVSGGPSSRPKWKIISSHEANQAYPPKLTWNPKLLVCRCFSFSKRVCSGYILVFWGVLTRNMHENFAPTVFFCFFGGWLKNKKTFTHLKAPETWWAREMNFLEWGGFKAYFQGRFLLNFQECIYSNMPTLGVFLVGWFSNFIVVPVSVLKKGAVPWLFILFFLGGMINTTQLCGDYFINHENFRIPSS